LNEYETTLRLELRPDWWVAGMLIFGHAAAGLLTLTLLTVAPTLSILFALGVVGSLSGCYREHVNRTAPGAVRAVSVSPRGDWKLVRVGVHTPESAKLKSSLLCDRWLVLRFELARSRARSIVLSSAATDPEQLRQLRARVRLLGSVALS